MEEGIKIRFSADTKQAEQGISKVAAALKTVAPGAKQATTALTNLSRVAQDAPFGFIGIANNLDPLLASFQALKKETGGTGAALKQLATSLVGPAGLAVGFSIVSSLIVAGIQKYGSLSAALNAVFGDSSSLANANRELGKSFSEAAGKAGGEIVTVRSLLSIARDTTLATDARKEAIKKLNDEYAQYLPKLTLDNIGTQAVTKSVDALNQSLLRQAKIRGVQDLIGEEFKKQAKLVIELEDAVKGANTTFGFLSNTLRGGGNTALGFISGLKGINKEFDESKVKATRFEQVLNSLLKDEAIGGTLFDDTKAKPTKVKKITDELKELKGSIPKTTTELANMFRVISLGIGEEFGGGIDTSKIILPIQTLGDAIQEQTAKIAETKLFEGLRLQAIKTAETVTNLLSPAFESFFNTLLSGSGNPFKAFGDAIKQLIAQLAAAAVKALLLKAITAAFTGGTSAGIGAILGAIPGIGSVGGVAGGINAGSIGGVANQGGQRLVAEVSGTALRFVLQKANSSPTSGF